MSQIYSFFDQLPDDLRDYTAEDYARYWRSFLSTGIYNGGSNLMVYVDGTDRNVHIKVGKAFIEGYHYENTDEIVLPLDEADGTLDRIDRIIIRLDRTPEHRYIKAFVLKGVDGSTPEPQALTRNDVIHEIAIADVKLIHNTTIVTSSNVTDQRFNNAVCGLVNSLIQVDTTEMQKCFDTFMESLKNNTYVSNEDFGNLADLKTSEKSNVVAAVNEVHDKAAGADHKADVAGEVFNATINGTVIEVNTAGKYELLPGKLVKFKLSTDTTGITGLKVDSNAVIPIKEFDGTVKADFEAGYYAAVLQEKDGSYFFESAPSGSGGDEGFVKKTTTKNEVLVEKVKKGSYVYCNKDTKIVKGFELTIDSGTESNNQLYSGIAKLGQVFLIEKTISNLDGVFSIDIRKEGSPTPLKAVIYETDGTLPTTQIYTSDNTINPSEIGTSFSSQNFYFSNISFNQGSYYAISFELDGDAGATSNNYKLKVYTSSSYSDGTSVYDNGSIWIANSHVDLAVVINVGVQLIPSIHTATSEDDLKVLANGNLLASEVGVYEGYIAKKAEELSGMPLGGGTGFSVETGTATIPSYQSNITINGLNNTDKTYLLLDFAMNTSNAGLQKRYGLLYPTSITSNSITINRLLGSSSSVTFRYRLITDNAIKSIQRIFSNTDAGNYNGWDVPIPNPINDIGKTLTLLNYADSGTQDPVANFDCYLVNKSTVHIDSFLSTIQRKYLIQVIER